MSLFDMTRDEFRRAVSMWGIAVCVFCAAVGWIFIRFGQAWSIADLPISSNVDMIVPAYIIADVAMLPVSAKLVDRFGCRNVLFVGPPIYILGSLLCIIAPSVEALSFYRLIQGAGAGLVLGLAFSAVGKFYVADKRGKCNELMTAAFALGSLFGSAVGYFFTDTFNWRAGFVIFSACMLIGFTVAWRFLPKEQIADVPLDNIAVVLTMAVFGSAAAYTQMVNIEFDLISVESGLMALLILALAIALMVRSYKVPGSPIPTNTGRYEKTMIILMFMFSLCGLGLIQYFFKLYLTYYEFDIYRASLMFVAMLAGAAITSIFGSRFVYRTGARWWIVSGSIVVTIGLVLTHFIAAEGIWYMALSLFVFGIGLGCIVTEILCSLQTLMPMKDVGQHTGNLMAVRMVGILAGNAVIGAYINQVVHGGRDTSAIDLYHADSVIETMKQYITDGLAYVANSLSSGFLTTALILAFITAALTILAYTLGRDDVEELEAIKGTSNEECQTSEE